MPRKRIQFEASASLQRLLGRELVPNDVMAIVELVKNGYDSRATLVRVLIQPDSDRIPGVIRVTDNGSGMSESDLTKLFMVAGYSQRVDEVKTAERVPTGEKGIGRFAADKLGMTLDVYSKTAKSRDTLHLRIDWKDFEDRLKRFNEVEAWYDVAASNRFEERGSGTILEIRKLRSKWDSEALQSVQVGLSDLLNPFDWPTDFSISLEIGNQYGVMTEHRLVPLIPDADLVMQVSVVGDKVHRVVKRRGERKPLVDVREGSPADLAYLRGLRARFLHFDKRPNTKN